MKHAYLIIAHNNFGLLQQLISLIDDERNDIFVHIDLKAGDLPILETKKSKLYFTDKRLDTRWMDESLIETELILFEKASQTDTYQYYHLISGADLPIKTQDYIHETCEKLNGKEFVGYVSTKPNESLVKKYHLFTRHYRLNNIFAKIWWKGLRLICESFVNTFFHKKSNGQIIKKGCEWVSITDEFCRHLVKRKDIILKYYKYTRSCDEVFLQTELWNSPFRKNIYDINDEYHSCMRCIDWTRGMPYTWREGDLDELMSSDAFFARKFSPEHSGIIKQIVKKLSNENANISKTN